jgi:hypothetical protein
MDKKEKSNHEADIENKNKGTKGTNLTLDKAQGNRSKQLEDKKKKK